MCLKLFWNQWNNVVGQENWIGPFFKDHWVADLLVMEHVIVHILRQSDI